MDRSDSNLQTRRKKKKRGKRLVDWISMLPDDIILYILSFLSSREAAATSLLSPRWSDLWKHTPNLDFVGTNHIRNRKTSEIEHTSWDVETCQHVRMVNSALESHQALFLKQFRICFYINKSGQSAVTKWLQFVWSRQVEILDLNFQCYSIKHGVVFEDFLGEMRPMKYLKRLSLRTITVSGEDISLFLRNCPLLRGLFITSSSVTSDVHVCGATLMLEELCIRSCIIRKSVINISAPNLSRVGVDARPEQLWFENVPRLTLACFGIKTPRYTMHHFSSAVSCMTSQLQKLYLYHLHPKKLLTKGFPQMPNLKLLMVQDMISVYEHGCLMPATSVISACPRLERFMFAFPVKFEDRKPDVERCPHQHLRKLKFEGTCATNIIQSVTYVSDSCDAFHKINTCSPHMSKAEVQAHTNHLKQLEAELSPQVKFKFFKFT